MIWSYLGYTELKEMISRRLTKIQKAEIVEAYRAGDNTNALAEKYGCTPNTINRTVKTLLSDREYTSLKERRSKNNKKRELINNELVKEETKDSEQINPLISLKEDVIEEDKCVQINEGFYSAELDQITILTLDEEEDFRAEKSSESQNNKDYDSNKKNQNFDQGFEEIAPLISDFDFDQVKQKSDFQILNYKSLPEIVYMIVDKKVELDLQLISDLPEWSFLPENELKRNAILLFSNKRSANRSCSRNQRVIKIPNTSIFGLSKSYLISKGVTRLILEDSLIALDN
ncbi:helix-turn-helix domain-containing protein [Prochlorococcus marinus]|uniref:Helix-turn-helix domain containing protein n=1 Tax=Prochlorococcus marinus XMU1408 TaxID=2213228 RepID=A0A318QYN3_PROMR|nr:helix-turn-helix domain-containing protein [Prochlorococcus marinus]MBW3042432.1 hypothetical protein [Prochlorococcus marinus str. XMU1408]PYE01164.1 hypothetical protein DNJ73_06975 [Prochlorococcus marinus XMU1408]